MPEIQFSIEELQMIYLLLVDAKNDAAILRKTNPELFTRGDGNLVFIRSALKKLRTVLRNCGIDPSELEQMQS